MVMHRILAAVDFSDSTLPVLQASAELARVENADLSVLYAMPNPTPITGIPWSGGAYSASAIDEDRVEYKTSLGRLHTMVEANGVANADCLCERGPAVERIREAAQRIHADLIVLGSHNHGRLFHTMFGSVREALLASAPCPVMVIPPHTSPS